MLAPARLLADDRLAVHVRHEYVGNPDGAVGPLVVLKNCEIRAAYGETAAVEGVKELGFFGAGGTEANVGASCLESLEVRARGDLAVEVLTGQPDLEVVGLRRGEAHVAGAK